MQTPLREQITRTLDRGAGKPGMEPKLLRVSKHSSPLILALEGCQEARGACGLWRRVHGASGNPPAGRLAPTLCPKAPGRHTTGSAHRLPLHPPFIHSPSHRSLLSAYCIQGAVPGSVTSTLTPHQVFSIKPSPPALLCVVLMLARHSGWVWQA